MRLPHDSEYDDCNPLPYSTANGINHDMPEEQTFVPQLPSTEGLDDEQDDVDYLSLATGHAVINHNVTTNTVRSVPMNLIDQVVASPEQTFEQLLASFTYLTAGLYSLFLCCMLYLFLEYVLYKVDAYSV